MRWLNDRSTLEGRNMKELFEKLEEVTKLPFRVYKEDTDLAVGSLGLSMNGISGKLNEMKLEFAHAPEYLARGQDVDVDETMAEYAKQLKSMRAHIGKGLETLKKCPEEDRQVKKAVGDFMNLFRDKLGELESESHLQDNGQDHAKQVKSYLQKLESLLDACNQYIRLHIGDRSPLA